MKNLSAISGIILAACTLQACNRAGNNSIYSDDTTGMAQDTTTILNLKVDKDDSLFAINAADHGMIQVEMGNLALKRGQSKQVKNFGAMMLHEDGKAILKLAEIAQSKKLTLPLTIDTAAQRKMAILAAKKGAAFDKAYINMMIADHEQDIKLLQVAATKVQDPDLHSFALKILPMLQQHLDAINAVQDSMNQ